MTEAAFAETMAAPEDGFDAMAPENVAPLVVWLASTESSGVIGRLFEVDGGALTVVGGWRRGPGTVRAAVGTGAVVTGLVVEAGELDPVYGA